MSAELTNDVLQILYSYLGLMIVILLCIILMWVLSPKRLLRWFFQSWEFTFKNCWIQLSCRRSTSYHLEDVIDRFQNDMPDQKLLKPFLEQEKTVRKILDIINSSIPEFQFSIMPTGSIREGYGKLRPSTSCLASDFDFMIIPEDCCVDLCSNEIGNLDAINFTSVSLEINIESCADDDLIPLLTQNETDVSDRLQNIFHHVNKSTECIFEASNPAGVKDMFCWIALKSNLPKRHKHWSNNIVYKKINATDTKVISNDKVRQKLMNALKKAKTSLESHYSGIDNEDKEGASFNFETDIDIKGPSISLIVKRKEIMTCDEFCYKACAASDKDWPCLRTTSMCLCCCCLFQKRQTRHYVNEGIKEELIVFEGDITLAIPCKGWPSETKEWFTRKRSWPHPNVINTIKSIGIHVVPKPSSHTSAITFITAQPVRNGSMDHYAETSQTGGVGCEFRFSFSQAEVILADSVLAKAKESFRVFRSTIKRLQGHLQVSYKVDSYTMKAIFYRTLENQEAGYWQQRDQSNLRMKFLMILFENLQKAVQHRYCQHYWISDINLFQHFCVKDDDAIIVRDQKEYDWRRLNKEFLQLLYHPMEYVIDDWVEHSRCIKNHCCFFQPDTDRSCCKPIEIPYAVSESGCCGPCPELPANNEIFAMY